MIPTPFFVASGPWRGCLAIAPAPLPGPHLEKNLRHWHRLGVNTVLSLMRPGERKGWEKESSICEALGMDFYSVPIMDHSAPEPEELPAIASRLQELEARLRGGERVVVHCFAGIGRSGMTTVALADDRRRTDGGRDRAGQLGTRPSHTGKLEEQREWLRAFDRYRRLS